VYPDVALAPAAARPAWMARAEELQLPLSWSGGWATANASSLTSLDAFATADLPAAALADFRAYAAKQGVTVPADANDLLQGMLAERVAETRWGTEGAYRVLARRDGAIRDAAATFARAVDLLKAAP
jgi:hypothetical protein